MSYRDILVYLDPSRDTDDRLAFAASLAASHEARLIGVDASSDAAFEGDWRDRATSLQDMFQEALAKAGLQGQFHSEIEPEAHGEHRSAHYADLIVASRPGAQSKGLIANGIQEDVLLSSGVPVLFLPEQWKPGPVGKNIVIAWNPSREATRAVHDAMPLLRKAEVVTVFTKGGEYRQEAEQLVTHLRHHDVEARVSVWPDDAGITVTEALYASLDTQDADLIVAGAYGHSQFYEDLFGGVSEDLTESPMIPLLLSH